MGGRRITTQRKYFLYNVRFHILRIMSRIDKLLQKIIRGNSDSNIRFDDLCKVLDYFGFQNRLKGSHHIYYRYDVKEIINLQPKDGLSKSYQVKQIRDVLIKYNINKEEND